MASPMEIPGLALSVAGFLLTFLSFILGAPQLWAFAYPTGKVSQRFNPPPAEQAAAHPTPTLESSELSAIKERLKHNTKQLDQILQMLKKQESSHIDDINTHVRAINTHADKINSHTGALDS